METYYDQLRATNPDNITLDWAYTLSPSVFNNMHHCVIYGAIDLVKRCIELGYPVNDKFCGISLFHCACLGKHFDIAYYLLDQGADPLVLSDNGSSTLHYLNQAFINSNKDDYHKLLDRLISEYDISAIVNKKNINGENSLYHALIYNNDHCVHHLLKLDVDHSDCMEIGLNHRNLDIRKMFEDYSSLSFVKGAE
jgi:ankyrin repeat protein